MIEQIKAAAAATPPVAAKSGSSAKAEPAKIATVVDTQPISPRLRFDAVSGVVVTEFLNGSSVTSQTPSAAALAYLRVGLSADGTSRNDKTQHDDTPVEA